MLESHGADRRGNGTADARVVATLTGNGEGTDVDLSTDLTVTGKPAQFGADVIADVSDKLMAQFASCAAGRLAEGFDAPPVTALRPLAPPGAAPEEIAAPTDAEPQRSPSQKRSSSRGAEAPEVPAGIEKLEEIEETIELGVVPEEIDGPVETRDMGHTGRRAVRTAGSPARSLPLHTRPAISPNPTLGRSAPPW